MKTEGTAYWSPASGEMSFVGVSASGHSVVLDDQVGDHGPTPVELTAIALAACTGMDVISVLQKKRQRITRYEVRVEADRAKDYPRVFTTVRIHHTVRGQAVDRAAVQRAIDLSHEKYCTVEAMLRKSSPVEHTFEIVDEVAAPVGK